MKPVIIHTLTENQAQQLHALYQNEWWACERTLEEVHRLLAGNSLLFALCEGDTGTLLAFARVLTDGVFKALLFDVIVHPAHRGAGLGRTLMSHILSHPVVSGVRHVELYCRPDRTSYYGEFGFTDDAQKEMVLMRRTGKREEPSTPPLAHPPAHP
ncbi:MAG TPA: GNAT family N-acetyltransferase [Verrucomicrobiales bacterium]|nr:GNAT family N-acetyltransferase [Verrucomicrobiales bacterium]